jgi:putative membrane protein
MVKKFVLSALVATAAWVSLLSISNAADKPAEKFLKEAIEGNLIEVQMGELAQEKGQSEAARSFGKELATDHGSANLKALGVAAELGMSPPSEPSKKHKSLHARLSKLSGPAFDRQFAREMVEDHKKDIREFEKAAKMPNASVAKFANEILPVLRKHLQSAEALERETKSSRPAR